MPNTSPRAVEPGSSGPALALPRPRAAASPDACSIPPAAAATDVAVDLLADRITVNPPGHLPGVVVGGELDMLTAPALLAAVTTALLAADDVHTGPGTTFLLDLRKVTFMDSAALHVLADSHALVEARGWTLGCTPPAERGPRRLLLFATAQGWLPRP